MAVAPASAPAGVKKVIDAANRIRTKPYVWGGGHGRWWDRGYDCSGAVSYALRGAGLLPTPLDSTGLMSWGEPEIGKWISVYANAGHTYAVIAGLRWDTAGSVRGTGPRWYASAKSVVPGKFVVRHPTDY
ncbi:MAG: C40 family peptidase [Thermoleophilia bacterium]|nr:C40 family peptidase [Thermoleophilia bacterium]